MSDTDRRSPARGEVRPATAKDAVVVTEEELEAVPEQPGRTADLRAASELEGIEERVLRAAYGSMVPRAHPLAQKDAEASPDVQAKLRALELQAFQRAGRFEELESDLKAEEADFARRAAAKSKIVERLRSIEPER